MVNLWHAGASRLNHLQGSKELELPDSLVFAFHVELEGKQWVFLNCPPLV
jgi:hypothetical protein